MESVTASLACLLVDPGIVDCGDEQPPDIATGQGQFFVSSGDEDAVSLPPQRELGKEVAGVVRREAKSTVELLGRSLRKVWLGGGSSLDTSSTAKGTRSEIIKPLVAQVDHLLLR
ncbi:MAG: hypothetical protein NT039_03455 [Candidatus Berkelbacteria bacterium]|nr:hypothetical protein [Candidatus Berkelbacteria bacterium]